MFLPTSLCNIMAMISFLRPESIEILESKQITTLIAKDYRKVIKQIMKKCVTPTYILIHTDLEGYRIYLTLFSMTGDKGIFFIITDVKIDIVSL
jgi:hypothetical protein